MNRLFLVFVLALLGSFFSSAASADTFNSIINNIVRSTPGITNVAINGGVRVTAAGAVDVAAGGLVIPVATSVAADVSAASIAAGAARIAFRAIPWVGAALVVAEVANQVSKDNISICPPPDFFCKKVSGAGGYYNDYQPGIGYGSAQSVGAAAVAYLYSANHCTSAGQDFCPDASSMTCSDTARGWRCDNLRSTAYPSLSGYRDVDATTHPDVVSPATSSDLQASLNKQFQVDAGIALRMKQQMDLVSQQNLGTEPPINMSNSPITVSSPPVSAPADIISTTTLTNPDGSTSTVVVRAQTTVTPQIDSNGTIQNPGVKFPSNTVTTTTTTNNTTNATNVTTNTTNNPPSLPVEKLQLPTDYNREATQKAILQQLDGSLSPDLPADQDARAKSDAAKTDKSLADKFTEIPSLFSNDKLLWFSWVWTPPVGSCSPSDYTGTVHGYSVAFDVCPLVSRVRELVGFIFAIFGALSIYTNLFRKAS